MSWAIAMCRAPEELSLAKRLREDGQEVYTPTCERKVRIRGRCSKRTVAAWPGYLLVRDPMPIDDSRFYRFILKPNFERKTLTDEEVEKYRLDERLGAFQTPLERESVLRLLGIGDVVQASVWPWQGRRGYVQSVSRGLVEIEGLDFPKPIRIPLALILPTNPVL